MLWGMTSQLNDLRSYSRHWLGEFIELYQAEECLWQPKHPDYSNNTARNNAYDKLVIKLKEVESAKADRSMVVRKINSLRSAFRRELRKINARPHYETRLWYYDKLAFIADHGNPKRLIANIVPELKQQKRSISLGFDEDDSMEFEDEQQIEPNSAHSSTQAEMQNETATATITAITNGDVVTIVKSENHKDGHQQDLSQAQNANETATLHHHHHHQQHLHTQTQPQHTTAVKVLEITSLDSNSQREIQQAVNSLEQQHQMQQLQQQQQQQNANQSAAAQLAAQIQQQVPTIQIAREHLQPLFGGAATTTYTATTAPTSTQRPNDEYDGIGINVASKLRIMSAHQRIIAEKLINDVLFNAQLDNLSVNSHLAQKHELQICEMFYSLRKINARPHYETRLWYYDKLAFIADHGNPKRLIANIVPELKQQKRSISLGFDEDDSMEFEDEQQIEPNSAHSSTQAEMQNETATATITAITNGDVVTIVKSENHKDGHQQDLSQAQNANETATLHHHHHHQQHLHTQTQPQHTTAVKVLEITSLDSNSQREIQQAVNSLEQQHQMQQLQQQQQQQNANQSAAAQLAAQIQQQVPTIQIAREHLQPLFGGAATTTYTATTAPTSTQRPNDEYDGIGINVASKLRIMSAHQRIIAEKLINDVLFNAQLDNLSVNSHLAQ
ncbi:uncharacterized protein ACN427_006491 [Glossina fuscipes fuscipes]